MFFDKFRVLRSARYTPHYTSPTPDNAGLVEYNLISFLAKSSTNPRVN